MSGKMKSEEKLAKSYWELEQRLGSLHHMRYSIPRILDGRSLVVICLVGFLFIVATILLFCFFVGWGEASIWAIFCALVLWLGKVWVNRISNAEKFYHEKHMAILKSHYELDLQRIKISNEYKVKSVIFAIESLVSLKVVGRNLLLEVNLNNLNLFMNEITSAHKALEICQHFCVDGESLDIQHLLDALHRFNNGKHHYLRIKLSETSMSDDTLGLGRNVSELFSQDKDFIAANNKKMLDDYEIILAEFIKRLKSNRILPHDFCMVGD
ncbi:hypothetical protein [Vibrio vulnificus]|uniref:hypothetical protein n=1 Tax=Vibrio vulnificus TaxID=672 RepID=UPI001CDBB468|nr:hypothetical protein [Vibrio vulnificus]MCA3912555.1 hypothetical protein [Vibrio vulnificus]